MEKNGFFCVCVKTASLLIFVAGILAAIFFVVHAYQIHDARVYDSHHARLYIQDLYVPYLVNKTTTFNTSVFVHLTFERDAALTRNSYGDFRMILSYGEYRSKSIRVGSRMVEGFNMEHKKRVDVKAVVEATEMPWEEAFRVVSVGKVAMVVELMMSLASDELPLVARVVVDDSGHMVYAPILFEKWNPRLNV